MKITVKSPQTDPRITIESDYGTAVIRPADLMHSECLILNIFTKGMVDIEEYDL